MAIETTPTSDGVLFVVAFIAEVPTLKDDAVRAVAESNGSNTLTEIDVVPLADAPVIE